MEQVGLEPTTVCLQSSYSRQLELQPHNRQGEIWTHNVSYVTILQTACFSQFAYLPMLYSWQRMPLQTTKSFVITSGTGILCQLLMSYFTIILSSPTFHIKSTFPFVPWFVIYTASWFRHTHTQYLFCKYYWYMTIFYMWQMWLSMLIERFELSRIWCNCF